MAAADEQHHHSPLLSHPQDVEGELEYVRSKQDMGVEMRAEMEVTQVTGHSVAGCGGEGLNAEIDSVTAVWRLGWIACGGEELRAEIG